MRCNFLNFETWIILFGKIVRFFLKPLLTHLYIFTKNNLDLKCQNEVALCNVL
jgi:hypothetical protein